MPIYQLDQHFNWFPGPEEWEPDEGVVAVGGDLHPERLKLAYYNGIFPWNEPNEQILWWHPVERMVLKPSQVKVSKSSRNLLNQKRFEFRFNSYFEGVIEACQNMPRKGQTGTWITDEHRSSFISLHRQGYAHSVEAWQNDKLVGGLYGLTIGGCFMGESMFSKLSNASKLCFIQLCRKLEEHDFALVDCQIYNPYLSSLGASVISRADFHQQLMECRDDKKDYQQVFS